jgi:membrane protease YdiL (CAAX protease family)
MKKMPKVNAMDDKTPVMMALSVFALERTLVSALNFLRTGMSSSSRAMCLNATTLLSNWFLPLLIVYKVEKAGTESLGLIVSREKYRAYAVYVAVGLALPALYFGFSRDLLVDFVEQLIFIGLAEEFFYRGYMMNRLCAWVGETKGLLLNAIVFSLAHVVFVVTRYGLGHPYFLAQSGFQTLLGGLLLGYIFLKAGDIVPGSVLHISMNLYLPRIGG